jgi:hypothetical protein
VDAFLVGQFFNAPIVSGTSTLPFVTGIVPVALLLVIVTRGRLGYQHDGQDQQNLAPASTGA